MNRAREKKNHTYNLTRSPKSGHVRGRVMLNIGTMNFAKKRWLWEYLKTIDGVLFFFFFPAQSGHVFIFFLGKLKNRNVPFFMVLKLLKTGQFRQNRDGWQVWNCQNLNTDSTKKGPSDSDNQKKKKKKKIKTLHS